MTNSPFDDAERAVWKAKFTRDERFMAALRIDPLLLDWKETALRLERWGYLAHSKTFVEVRRFLADWTKRINARHLMISLPPDYVFPAASIGAQLIERAILPHCREFGLPFAVMPGVKRGVNPQLKLAGDGVGLSNLNMVQNLCAQFPENKLKSHRPGAGKPARAMRSGAQVSQPAYFRLLVVHQHAVADRGNHPDAD